MSLELDVLEILGTQRSSGGSSEAPTLLFEGRENSDLIDGPTLSFVLLRFCGTVSELMKVRDKVVSIALMIATRILIDD